jgi:hypothetical protein
MKFLNKFFLILLLIFCIFLGGCNDNTKYEDASQFSEGLAAVKLRGLYGFIDTEENLVITPTYEEVRQFYNDITLVKKDGLWGVIDKKNNVIIPFNYEEATLVSDNLLSVKKNGKFGCIDLENNLMIDFISQDPISIYNSDNQNIAIITENNLKGFINLKTGFKVEPKYTSVMPWNMEDSLIYIEKDQKYGFVALDTDTIVEPKYDYSCFFEDGLSRVSIDGKFGYINTKDEIVIEPIYDSADSFLNGLAIVSLNGKTGCIDKTGNLVIPFIYDYIYSFYQGDVTVVSLDNKVSLVNTKGELLFEPKFQSIDLNSENDMFPASYTDKTGNFKNVFINKQGGIVLNTDYTKILPFFNGFASITKLGKNGILASNGMEIIPPIYDEAYSLDEYGNTFQVCLDGKWGIVDKTQNEILECEYNIINKCNEDTFIINKDGKWGVFNMDSNKFTDIIYDDIRYSDGNTYPFPVKLEDHWLYIDKDGNKIN